MNTTPALDLLRVVLAAAEPPRSGSVPAFRMFQAVRAELVKRRSVLIRHPRLHNLVTVQLAKPRFIHGSIDEIGMIKLSTHLGIRNVSACVTMDPQDTTDMGMFFQIKGRAGKYLDEVPVVTTSPRDFLRSIVGWFVVDLLGPAKVLAAAEPQPALGRMSISLRGVGRKGRSQPVLKALQALGLDVTIRDISDRDRWLNFQAPIKSELFRRILGTLVRLNPTAGPLEIYTGRGVYDVDKLPESARLIWNAFQSTANERRGNTTAATEPAPAAGVVAVFRDLRRRLPETTPDLYPREHKRIRFQGLDVVALNHDGDNTIRIHVLADDRDICGFAEIPYSPKLPPAVRVELQGPRGVAYHRITSARDYRDLLRQILAWVTVQYRRNREQSQHIHFPETR